MAQKLPSFDSKFLENFKILDVKGGKFSTLYTVTTKSKSEEPESNSKEESRFAIKVVGIKRFIPTAKKLASKQFTDRLQKIRSLNHPNVISYFATWYENPPLSYQYSGMPSIKEKQKLLFLQMEYCDLKSLRDWLSSPLRNEEDSWKIAAQVARGLGYLHEMGLMHGNLKPENILMKRELSDSENDLDLACVKLSDYGLKSHEPQKTRYTSPESQFPINGSKLSSKSDSYSFGVVLAELILSTRDISCNSDVFTRFSTSKDPFCLKNYVKFYPPNILKNEELAFICSLTSSSAKARPTVSKILEFISLYHTETLAASLTTSSFLPWRMTKDYYNIDEFQFLPLQECLILAELELDLTLAPDIEILQTLPQIRKLVNLTKLSLKFQHLVNLNLMQKLSLPKLKTFRLQLERLEKDSNDLEGYKFLSKIFRFFSQSQVQRNMMNVSIFLKRFELLHINVQNSLLKVHHSSLLPVLDILTCTEFHEIVISVPVDVPALPDYLCEIEMFCEKLTLSLPTTFPFVFPYIYSFSRLKELSISLSSGDFPQFDLSLIPETLRVLKLTGVEVYISEDNIHSPRPMDLLIIKNCKHSDGFWEMLDRNFNILKH